MYDSDKKLKEVGLQFLLKEYNSIHNVHKKVADEYCLSYINKNRSEFSRPDLITAGTTISHLISDGYLNSNVIEGRGLIVTLSNKGKEYINKALGELNKMEKSFIQKGYKFILSNQKDVLGYKKLREDLSETNYITQKIIQHTGLTVDEIRYLSLFVENKFCDDWSNEDPTSQYHGKMFEVFSE